MASTFRCTIVTPEAQVFDQDVVYVSIPAHDGQVGLAHLRAPMLVKLGDGPLRIDEPGGASRFFFVGGGFAQMSRNVLTVLTAEALAVDQIDRAKAEAALAEALQRKAVGDTDVADRHREQTRARALIAMSSHRG